MKKVEAISIVFLMFLAFVPYALADHGSIFGAELNHVLDFPHFGNGELIRSELVLVNLGSASHPVIYFSGPDGEVMEAGSVVEMMDHLVVLEDGGLTTTDPLPSLGELTIPTNGSGETVRGSIQVVSDSLMGGFLRYTLYGIEGISVAGVASAVPAHNFIVPVERKVGGVNTGLAIHNLNNRMVGVDCQLMKDGEVLVSADIDLAPNGQSASFIDEIFSEWFSEEPASEEEPQEEPEAASSFRGSVSCGASSRVTSLALELDTGTNVLTTLPVIPRPSGADFFF